MKTKKKLINNILKTILILVECIGLILGCAVVNVFSEENELRRMSKASGAIILSSIGIPTPEADYKEGLEAYEEAHRWKGPVLSKRSGTVNGPSGKETYYNLNMAGVVRIMRRMGNEDEYWVREDGCKMLGDYIMVAANLNIRPRGSLVETSLGTGIVCDTGGFAKRNPYQIDVAVTW